MARSKTTSITRPTPRSAAKAGQSRLGDVTRSIPIDKRVSRRPKFALFAGFGALVVICTAMAAVFLLPIGTWKGQDEDLTQRSEQLDALQTVNGQLAAEVERLKTDDGIREAAGEEIFYQQIGEERTSILPLPLLPTDLPDGWPYNVFTEIFNARTAGPAPVATD